MYTTRHASWISVRPWASRALAKGRSQPPRDQCRCCISIACGNKHFFLLGILREMAHLCLVVGTTIIRVKAWKSHSVGTANHSNLILKGCGGCSTKLVGRVGELTNARLCDQTLRSLTVLLTKTSGKTDRNNKMLISLVILRRALPEQVAFRAEVSQPRIAKILFCLESRHFWTSLY